MNTALNLLKDVQGVIFDLDGVLVDTARFHFQAWKRLAQELGIPFTEIDNEQLKGVSRIASLTHILSRSATAVSPAEMTEMATRKNNWYLEYVSEMNENDLLAGTLPLLQWLKQHDYLLAIGSASKNAQLVLEKTALKPFFDAIIDGNQVSHSKPHPEVFLKAAAALGLPAAACLVFEDAQAGVDAAGAAGMKVIGIGKDLIGTAVSINSLAVVLT